MTFTTLDIIIRRNLLENSSSIHYYCEYLFHAATCLRELTFDTLKIINTVNLPMGEYGEINLPDDYVDDVALSFATGLTLRPVPHKNSINPLRVHNADTGQFERQTQSTSSNGRDLFYPFVGGSWFWNVSDWGEPTGRLFGATGGNPNGYSVIKERRQIQVYGGTSGGSAILQYITDGQSVDSASMVDTLAFSTIQSYINWQISPYKNDEYSSEARKFFNARRKLRGRLNGMTTEDIRNILHSAYTAVIKN